MIPSYFHFLCSKKQSFLSEQKGRTHIKAVPPLMACGLVEMLDILAIVWSIWLNISSILFSGSAAFFASL
jgi:hypothetical protein